MLPIKVVTLGARVCISFLFFFFNIRSVCFWWLQMQIGYGKLAVADMYHFLHMQGGAGRCQRWRAVFAARCEIPCRKAAVTMKGQMWLGDEAFLGLVPEFAGRASSEMSKKGALSVCRFKLRCAYWNSSSLSLFWLMGLEASLSHL